MQHCCIKLYINFEDKKLALINENTNIFIGCKWQKN
jgi:hypothetical protein